MQVKFKEFFYLSNLISLSRIILIFPIVYLLTLDTPEYNWLILLLIVIAALTDILDGYVSRKMNMITDLGIVLDPLADKLAMAVILIALVIFRKFHLSLVILLMYRDLLIVIIGALVVKKIDKPVMANKWGKMNTSLIAILVVLFLLEFFNYFYIIILIACYVSILISGISYARIAEKALFESKTGKVLYRAVLVILTLIVTFFAFQMDRNFYPGFWQEAGTYHVHHLQHDTVISFDLDQGRSGL
jgi:CDP-diacylglycerol--glycerol-3-phosphate 3-phosphatidyltransferase